MTLQILKVNKLPNYRVEYDYPLQKFMKRYYMPFAEVIPHYILFPNAPQHKLQVHLCKDANLCYLNPCSQFVDDIQQTLLYDKGDA